MPTNITWPGESGALRRMFGTKGGLPLALDEIAVPVAIIGDTEDSPWESSTGVGRSGNHGGTAATNAAQLVLPGVGTVLRIDMANVINDLAGVHTYAFTILSPADIAAATLGAQSSLVALTNVIDPTGAVNRVGSTMGDMRAASVLGDRFFEVHVDADRQSLVTFKHPVYIDGSARGGIGGLGIWVVDQNIAMRASVLGREYLNRA